MIALIDGDIVAHSCAFAADKEDFGIAAYYAQGFIDKILQGSGAEEYEVYITGKDNFRYKVYPEYKGNRKDVYRPQWEKALKQYLVDQYGAQVTEGCEADDQLGVRQTELGDRSIICTIDKDLDMIPGWHYRWALIRKGVEVSPERTYYVTPEEALYNFYYQLLIGDTTDNIKGAVGIGPKKAELILQDCKTEEEFLNAVRDHFSCEEELEMNAKVLWIWRKDNDIWSLNNIETTKQQSEGEDRTEDSA